MAAVKRRHEKQDVVRPLDRRNTLQKVQLHPNGGPPRPRDAQSAFPMAGMAQRAASLSWASNKSASLAYAPAAG